MEQYNEIIKTKIGKPVIRAKVSNPFPIIGETVKIESESKWVTMHAYSLKDGETTLEKSNPSVMGHTEVDLLVRKAATLMQSVYVENTEGTTETLKNIYCMPPQVKPYFNILVSKEIIRNDGEETHLVIVSENGYDLARELTIEGRIYKENEETNPVYTFATADFSIENGKYISVNKSFEARGIYDIEVDITDILSGEITCKRINKLITVTPKLAPRGEAVEYLIPDAKIAGSDVDKWCLNGSDYPEGSTIVLKEDSRYGSDYLIRLRFKNFQGTAENPYIITIDQDSPLIIKWFSYFGMNLDNCKFMVLDGRGYQNIDKGIVLRASGEGFCESAFSSGNGSSDFEVFEFEIDKPDFAGMFLKTDPDPNKPEYWYPTFKMNKILLHHNYIHNSGGEGSYIGHYNMAPYTKQNSQGQSVTYRAHHVYDSRVYRCVYENLGYDALQWNNAENLEICYNQFIRGGTKGEQDQASGLSLGLSGKIYNNFMVGFTGPSIQFGTLGRLDIFNNVLVNGSSGHMGLLLLATAEVPEQNPNNQGYNELPLYIYNNVITTEARPPLTSRNTTQYKNVHFVDNFCIQTAEPLFGGQASDTIELWKKNAKGNVSSVQKVTDYPMTDNSYKFGDSYNGDYRINFDSLLADAGTGSFFKFDYRGYKNWYSGIYPAGSYMGIYKNAGLDERFRILSILFDENVEKTETIDGYTFVSWTCYGTIPITEYRMSESENIDDLPWLVYNPEDGGQYCWSFSEGKGSKTIYVQLKNQNGEITPVSKKSINWLYRKSIVGINATANISLNGEFDPVSKIQKVRLRNNEGKEVKIKDILGVDYGTISSDRSLVIYSSGGLYTENDAWIYPDFIAINNESSRLNTTGKVIDPPTTFTIKVQKGSYIVRLFSNSNKAISATNLTKLTTITPYFVYEVNGQKVRAVSLYNNLDQQIEIQNVNVEDDGLLVIKMYWEKTVLDQLLLTGAFGDAFGALNCIEIQEADAVNRL